MQGWSVLCSGRFDRVMLLLLHREGATSGRQQKTTSPRACGPMRGRLAIPACAGQPEKTSLSLRTFWAYPRVCGATEWASHGKDPSGHTHGRMCCSTAGEADRRRCSSSHQGPELLRCICHAHQTPGAKKNRKPLKHAGFECLLAFLRPLTGIPDRTHIQP